MSETFKEAQASCNLDGDTMDCTKCKANILIEIARFLHGEISKEKLAENIRMNFYELNSLLRGWQFREAK